MGGARNPAALAAHGGYGKKLLKALHLYLNGKGTTPPEWVVSRYCEEFGYRPKEALREIYGFDWPEAPWGLHERIMLLRGYAQAKAAVDSGDKDAIKRYPLTARVYEIVYELGMERAAGASERCEDGC